MLSCDTFGVKKKIKQDEQTLKLSTVNMTKLNHVGFKRRKVYNSKIANQKLR